MQLSYAIGVAEPLSVYVDTYGTGKKTDIELVEIIRKNWDLRPGVIGIDALSFLTVLAAYDYLQFASLTSRSRSTSRQRPMATSVCLMTVRSCFNPADAFSRQPRLRLGEAQAASALS